MADTVHLGLPMSKIFFISSLEVHPSNLGLWNMNCVILAFLGPIVSYKYWLLKSSSNQPIYNLQSSSDEMNLKRENTQLD